MGLAVCKIVAFYLQVHPMWHVVLGESPGRDNFVQQISRGDHGDGLTHQCMYVLGRDDLAAQPRFGYVSDRGLSSPTERSPDIDGVG